MSQITINNQAYNIDELSETAKQQLANIQLVDAEIAKLQQQLAIFQTARGAYVNALVAAVEGDKKPVAKKRVSKAKA